MHMAEPSAVKSTEESYLTLHHIFFFSARAFKVADNKAAMHA